LLYAGAGIIGIVILIELITLILFDFIEGYSYGSMIVVFLISAILQAGVAASAIYFARQMPRPYQPVLPFQYANNVGYQTNPNNNPNVPIVAPAPMIVPSFAANLTVMDGVDRQSVPDIGHLFRMLGKTAQADFSQLMINCRYRIVHKNIEVLCGAREKSALHDPKLSIFLFSRTYDNWYSTSLEHAEYHQGETWAKMVAEIVKGDVNARLNFEKAKVIIGADTTAMKMKWDLSFHDVDKFLG